MSLYFVFSIDGDWDEYFFPKLSEAEREPDKKILLNLIRHEIRISATINNKVLHFVHTSSVAHDFFLQPEFISLWKKIEARGGSVGVHCHSEDLYREGYLYDPEKMEKVITSLTNNLRGKGLNPISYRGGYLTFCEKTIPFLEKNGLFFDFSCDPDRYLWHEGELVADWRGAPDNYYRISYEDHRKPGKSKVIEIPLGTSGKDALYIDITSLKSIWKAARALAKKDKEESGDIIVSVLSHTYEFSSFWKRLRIRSALLICKRYGKFINDREAIEIINTLRGAR
ncbi:MAG: hypothetical protein HQ593_00275 [Candidatus Omnitrophica bacterium]|nr:hypothetical protein [Candidatus Omnitrophota bacterium]